MIKKYSEIEKIGKDCIFFDDGTKIQINDCVRKDTNTCIAERDITATPPYFDFFTGDKIIFDKKGLFAQEVQRQCSEEQYFSIINDGNIEIDELVDLVVSHFGLR